MIHIVAHNKINFDFLNTDASLDKNMFHFFLTEGKVKNHSISDYLASEIVKRGFKYKLEWKLPIFNPELQRKRFFAPSALYHAHLNESEFSTDDKYSGIMEYDILPSIDKNLLEFVSSDIDIDNFSFSKVVSNIVAKHSTERFMIFPSIRHQLSRLDKQKNIKMAGQHWLDFFINDYNDRYNKGDNICIEEFRKCFGDKLIPTQQTFISDIETFKEIAFYVYDFIEYHGYRHDSIDTFYQPFPATIMERFIGLYMFILSEKNQNTYLVPLIHHHSSNGKY